MHVIVHVHVGVLCTYIYTYFKKAGEPENDAGWFL